MERSPGWPSRDTWSPRQPEPTSSQEQTIRDHAAISLPDVQITGHGIGAKKEAAQLWGDGVVSVQQQTGTQVYSSNLHVGTNRALL